MSNKFGITDTVTEEVEASELEIVERDDEI